MNAIYILLALFLLWMLYKQFAPVSGLRNLTPQQFKSEYKGNKLVDVRESHEFKGGHITGAVNIPLSQLSKRLGEIPQERQVYLYCQSGMRSKQAAMLLSRSGYSQLAHLRGGILTWNGPTHK
ncbi:Rhodanese-related sulfurtransferase [Paenibacillus algorifonticola]|uniref:Rhodanese-related sulfurtransferase n=1 Tax=Paenibacillus algorifonticola TaxID=684063 RepID=A0A1I1YS57_9BACL|nr:Rhodanese-related sulfurtransferase [Paenibacillus algorifonticola]